MTPSRNTPLTKVFFQRRVSKFFHDTHLQHHTCHSLRVLVSGTHRRCVSVQWCDVTSEFQVHTWRNTTLKNQSAHAIRWTQFPRSSLKLFARDGTSGRPQQGGYAGVRLVEAQNPRPVEHERDHAEEEPSARRTCIDEAAGAAPGSQDSSTRGVRNLQLEDVPTVQPVPA